MLGPLKLNLFDNFGNSQTVSQSFIFELEKLSHKKVVKTCSLLGNSFSDILTEGEIC